MKNKAIVAIFETQEEGERAAALLRQVGIEAEADEHVWWETVWFVTKSACRYAHLSVAAEDSEAALERLQVLAAESKLPGAIRCPECHSLRVHYPQFTGKFTLPNVWMALAAEAHLIEKDFYCEDCHATWPREQKVDHRQHLAPNYFLEDVPTSRK
jgi:hypothetical protein